MAGVEGRLVQAAHSRSKVAITRMVAKIFMGIHSFPNESCKNGYVLPIPLGR